MFIIFVFYNNSEVCSYLHNSYIANQQTMNFITTPNWKVDETFELPMKHDMLQNIVHVFTRHPFLDPPNELGIVTTKSKQM